ncbi:MULTISPECIES: TylF/MycF/NovP-related O-methyltransferase [Pseudomonas]|uniref:dTDP-6-deoxy-L-hexose 3-O-methyltransferase n=1 Tax=Pseudomonas putida TaxID=303 RepID=A0A3M8TJC5_PSEPU|nr:MULTISPECIES: TylF/MycF/NovP-related O-methyltransferase [Pseudomonas]KXK67553.1 dTDP-6-deoxy-L-hexose 3-O-methyltransferase [Pseudomonas monteilii]MCO6689103.1 TylF/MycF family methyltransferase [Pseudomonas shirazica]KYC22883.1 dTDP-6-deoxy-L-hexose 3-O-methyltransferase [Pseudomonas sp. ABFPK]MBA6113477.1 class I SAM-dependent methyltransferase [Pseudomonas asiatica]MCE0852620.1 TylF/MycF family methyltransferase [Pseudomonas asiatica]
MTKRRLTAAEVEYNEKRATVLSKVDAQYVADAPFVFANRITVTAALSRMELFKMVQDVPGAIVECGVYKGNSLMLYMHLSMILEPYAINRSIIGFDTFQGFASIDKENDPTDINETMFSDTDDSILQEMIDTNDLVRPVNRIPRCEIIKGDILETVPAFVKTRPDLVVAMLILDTDLYSSTKVALETFLPYMPKGAIVVLDEVAYRNFPGETAALRDVLDLNKIELKRLPFDSTVGYFRV